MSIIESNISGVVVDNSIDADMLEKIVVKCDMFFTKHFRYNGDLSAFDVEIDTPPVVDDFDDLSSMDIIYECDSDNLLTPLKNIHKGSRKAVVRDLLCVDLSKCESLEETKTTYANIIARASACILEHTSFIYYIGYSIKPDSLNVDGVREIALENEEDLEMREIWSRDDKSANEFIDYYLLNRRRLNAKFYHLIKFYERIVDI